MEMEALRAALVERFGDLDFEVRENRYTTLIPGSYGYYVYYGPGGPSLGEMRVAVDELSPTHSVILHQRETKLGVNRES